MKKFVKKGLIFKIPDSISWMKSHAMCPTPILLPDRIRVLFSCRDGEGQSHIGAVDLDRKDPTKILSVDQNPILSPGTLGTFDDCGVTCDSAVQVGNEIYLYYIGWNQLVKTPYRNTIGLAISKDQGKTFERHSLAPLMERTPQEPYFSTSPWVLKEGAKWQMWYAAITEWILIGGKPECLYHIKHAASEDGIHWNRSNRSCILPLGKDEANVRPTVIFSEGLYRMWFCFRGSTDFRDGSGSYGLGYAESSDGVSWKRLDDKVFASGISDQREEWEATMQSYPAIIQDGQREIIFYNGNGFGRDGFGCAIRE